MRIVAINWQKLRDHRVMMQLSLKHKLCGEWDVIKLLLFRFSGTTRHRIDQTKQLNHCMTGQNGVWAPVKLPARRC